MAIETATTLLEREGELAVLGDALTAAGQGDGQIVLVEAGAGLGKTSLLKAALEKAGKAGFTRLQARATELERDFAYGCIRQLLEPTVLRASADQREQLFDGAAALSAPLFAPTGAASAQSGTDNSFAMLHGLHWLLNNMTAEEGVALAVDDLQWADAESLRFLTYLAPRLDGIPLVVFASTRPREGDTGAVSRLASDPETRVLHPGPLSIEATTTICEQRLGAGVTSEFAAACRTATGGNPFFLEALLREAREQGFPTDSRGVGHVRRVGPAAVAQALRVRLSDRPDAASLVRAVAIAGDGTGLAQAAALAELPEREAARCSDLLVALSILSSGDRLEFAHPIVREAVYGDIGPRERAQAHARAAELLAAAGAPAERVAAQIAEAEPIGDEGRVELLRRVAADALARGAPAAAAALLRRARAEPPPPASRGEVLLELSSAELRLGMPEAAIDQLAEASELIREPESLTTAVRLLAAALTWSGQADRAVEAIGSAIETLGSDDRELALLLEAERSAYAQQGSLEARAPVAARLERYGELQGATPGERLLLATLAFERARASESAADAAAHIERVLAGERLLAEQELDVAGTLYLLVIGLLATDALDLAERCLERMLADARARASFPAQAFVIVHRGWVSMRRGAVAQAEADARLALNLLTTYDIHLGTRFALALLILSLIERGEVGAADAALRDSGVGDEIPPGLASNALLEARSLLRLAQGRTQEGLDDMLVFGRHDEHWGGANPLASRWRSQASLALAAKGDAEGAHCMALEDLERARRWGAASGVGVALRAVALVEGGTASIDRLREAARVLEHSPARLEQARALTDLGAALRRANRRADARGPLQYGLDLAGQCGALALAARARTELRAAGAQPKVPEGVGVEQLTVSERRVAELAAQGQSNPQIAQTLFVTRKTVETHLGRVYRKLDISGRGELGPALDSAATGRSGT